MKRMLIQLTFIDNSLQYAFILKKSVQFLREAFKKKNRGFSEFGTKGGRVSDLNHYFEQQWNSEKGEGGGRKRYL